MNATVTAVQRFIYSTFTISLLNRHCYGTIVADLMLDLIMVLYDSFDGSRTDMTPTIYGVFMLPI